MSNALAEVRKSAMSLPSDDRFVLAHDLLDSLDQNEIPVTLEELDRRYQEMQTDPASSISLEELDKSMQETLDGKDTTHP